MKILGQNLKMVRGDTEMEGNMDKLYKQLLKNNECYIVGGKMQPIGIVVHSTAANNPYLHRYVAPDDGRLGKNKYNNHWNQYRPNGRQICCHAFIGKLNNGDLAVYQTLPWTMQGWHGASGKNGSVNDNYIGFEICEDDRKNKKYAQGTYDLAVELCAYLSKKYPTINTDNIISHYEAGRKGIASKHIDPKHWWDKHGLTMEQFRRDVRNKLNKEEEPQDVLYRVQVGAFRSKKNANNYVQKLKKDGYDAFVFTDKSTAKPKSKKRKIKVGDKVKIKKGAKTYTGGDLDSWVYNATFYVSEISKSAPNRIVISRQNTVIAAMWRRDLIRV